jgi:lysozyme family protein
MRAGLAIVDLEARRNAKGHVMLYELPGNDGGGRWEIAGINSRYHPQALDMIRALPPSKREAAAAQYIEEYTLKGTGLDKIKLRPGTRFAILDAAFNRGPGGAAWIVQQALKSLSYSVAIDMQWGPKTRALLESADVEKSAQLLGALHKWRERYEIEKVGKRDNFWKGLVSRWGKVLSLARAWNAE